MALRSTTAGAEADPRLDREGWGCEGSRSRHPVPTPILPPGFSGIPVDRPKDSLDDASVPRVDMEGPRPRPRSCPVGACRSRPRRRRPGSHDQEQGPPALSRTRMLKARVMAEGRAPPRDNSPRRRPERPSGRVAAPTRHQGSLQRRWTRRKKTGPGARDNQQVERGDDGGIAAVEEAPDGRLQLVGQAHEGRCEVSRAHLAPDRAGLQERHPCRGKTTIAAGSQDTRPGPPAAPSPIPEPQSTFVSLPSRRYQGPRGEPRAAGLDEASRTR